MNQIDFEKDQEEVLNRTENISKLAWDSLENKFKNAKLQKITIWENDRTYCTYIKNTAKGDPNI